MVAGAGFEPYDLRVMSPMSYQTALPRDKALACASVFLMLVYDTSYMTVCQGFLPNNCMFFAQNLPVFDKTCTIATLWNTFECTLQKT